MRAGQPSAWRAGGGLAAAVLVAASVARAEPITPRLGLPEAASPLGEFRVDDLEPDEPRLPFYKAR